MTKERIVIGINSLVSTVHSAYSNHIQLFFRLGRNWPQYDFIFVNPPRMSIDRMRNMAAEVALQSDAKYLIFIDDDVLVPFTFLNSFIKILESENSPDIIAGNVQIRGYPFDYMLFRWDDEHQGLYTLKEVPKDEVMDVDAVGFSLCLIKVDLLRKVSKPYFVSGFNHTEDVFFCLKVRQEFPATRIVCDTGVICAHILWAETISDLNRDAYTKYYEERFPEECASYKLSQVKNKEGDRGLDYLDTVKKTIGIGA